MIRADEGSFSWHWILSLRREEDLACEVYYFMLIDLILVCWYGLLAVPSESLYDCICSIVDAVLCYCRRLPLLFVEAVR